MVSSALYRCAPAPVCVGTHIKVKTGRGWRTPEVPALDVGTEGSGVQGHSKLYSVTSAWATRETLSQNNLS